MPGPKMKGAAWTIGKSAKAAIAALLMISLAPGASAQLVTSSTESKGEPRLGTFPDTESDDPKVMLNLLKHEVFALEQKVIWTQFFLQEGCCVKMDFLYYPSGRNLIPAYVFGPRQREAGKRYPTVILLHGGLHQRFNVEWFRLVSEMVGRGYIVMFPEYRGSQGYGEALYRNDYGVSDVADTLAAADYLSTKPYVDPSRLALVGESRGGMVTLLAIEQAPARFKAAIDIVGLTDFVAYMAYKPNWRRENVARESASFKGQLPDTNLAAYMKVSPINYVEKIQTPLLVLATTGDEIAPLTLHTGRLIEALKAYRKVYDAKIYDNAPGGHVFLSGDSPEQADAFERIFAWLEKHVGR